MINFISTDPRQTDLMNTFGETREAFEARFEAWRRDNGIGAR